jgi:hypothetical protein
MSEQQTLLLWILLSGGFGVVLGTAFGATVGAITWLSGRAAGTLIGFRVARAYERAAERELTFLGAVGVLVGTLIAWRIPSAGEVLRPAAAAVTLLVAIGSLFGFMALALLRSGIRAVVPLFFGAMLGAAVGLFLGRTNGLFAGLVLGLIGGTAFAFLRGPRAS